MRRTKYVELNTFQSATRGWLRRGGEAATKTGRHQPEILEYGGQKQLMIVLGTGLEGVGEVVVVRKDVNSGLGLFRS